MSGSQITSPFGDPNILYRGLSGEGLIANQNALLQQEQSRQLFPLKLQGAQQDLAANETEAVARAAGGLLTLPEDQAAAAYPQVIAGMRAQGYKLANAPDTYPGHTALQGLFQRGLSVPEQISSGMYTPPGLADALKGVYGGGQQGGGGGGTLASPYKAYAAGTPAPPGAYGEGGKGANIQVPAAYMPFYQEASQRTGIPVDVLIAQHRQESGFNPNATGSAGEIGIGQVMPSTALAPGYGMAPLGTNADAVRTALRDPRTNINFSADYLKARLPQGANPSDPEAIRRALVNYNGGGDPNYVANVTRYLPPPASVAQAAAAPQPAAGVAARTGGVDVAGPGAGAPSAAPAADLVGPRPMPPTGAGAPVATPSSIANTPVVPTGPGINPVLAGQPAATALSPQNALAPPATPPQAAAPATGTNSPQFQAALALQNQALELETRFPGNPQAKAAAAALRQRAALYMQADSVSYDPESGIGTKAITGERLNAATPNAHYVWDDKQGAYVDTSGTHPPVTPPTGRIVNVPGVGAIEAQPGHAPQLIAPATRAAALDALSADRPKIDAITQGGQASQAGMLRLNEMADIIPRLATGPTADLRTKGAALLESLGASSDTIKRYTGMESGSLAEELIKLSIATVGQAAKSDIGSNVGIQSLQLYQSSNPGMALLPDANKRMTNMLRVSAQLSQDYTNGALSHFNPQQDAILNPKPEDAMAGRVSYSPISNYNQAWQERNNPQIGAATMGILNGDPFDKWARRATPEQASAAVAMAARIDPNVRIPTADGFKPAAVILSHPMTPAPH